MMRPKRVIAVFASVAVLGPVLFAVGDDASLRPGTDTDFPIQVEVNASGDDSSIAVGGIPPCDLTLGCGIPDPASGVNTAVAACKNRVFRQTVCTNPGASAVDKRLCALGVVMDGDSSEALSLGQSCRFLGKSPVPPLDPSSFRPVDRGVGFVDAFKDSGVLASPGPFGTDDQALCPDQQGPSGFNIGCSVLWFAPDDNPTDGVDNSFLYVAWDLGDRLPLGDDLPLIPVPFDVDANASACSQFSDDDNYPFKEFTQPEEYQVAFRSCANLAVYDPRQKFPLNNLDELSALMRLAAGEGLRAEFRVDDVLGVGLAPVNPEVLYFPTADAVGGAGTNPTDGCVERELEVCRGRCPTAGNNGTCSGSGAACSSNANCPAGQRCLGAICTEGSTCPGGGACDIDADFLLHESMVLGRNANNVELVIKRIETSGFMGPHTGRVCSGNGKACRSASECPNGQTCNASAITADSAKAVANRLSMSQMVANLFADADADGGECGSEELGSVAVRIPLPGLEVKKEIRCAQDGTQTFAKQVDALVDSFVEFQITVENVGNEDLTVRLSDILTEAQIGSLASCSATCRTCSGNGEPCEFNSDCPLGQSCVDTHAFLEATLTSPQRGLNNTPVNEANAAGFLLEPVFFHTDPTAGFPATACLQPGSFLKSVKDNEATPLTPTSAVLGVLKGRPVAEAGTCSRTGAACNSTADCPNTFGAQFCLPTCQVGDGDKLVLRFAAKVGQASGAFCEPPNRRSPDCENAVTATGVQTSAALACATDADCATLVPSQFCIAGFCGVRDQARVIDTTAERQAAADDNTATLNILCRTLEFEKTVGIPGQEGSFVTGEDQLNLGGAGGGPPPGESCCEVHNSPGCSDSFCEATICGIDPFCCGEDAQGEGTWDATCVANANSLCDVCQIQTASAEGESHDAVREETTPEAAGKTARGAEAGVRESTVAAGGGGAVIEYRYKAANTGEVDEDIVISDAELCADIVRVNNAIPGGITIDGVGCPICPSGSVAFPATAPTATECLIAAPVCPAGQTCLHYDNNSNAAHGWCSVSTKCQMTFSSLAAIQEFMQRDQRCVGGGNPGANCKTSADCTGGGTCQDDPSCVGEEPLSTTDRPDCYRNCASASASANPTDVNLVCHPPLVVNDERSFTTVCSHVCEIDVVKQVRCLPNCSTTGLGPEDGWKCENACSGDPTRCCEANSDCVGGQTCQVQPLLDVTPGACVQYRVKVTNNSDTLDLCALCFDDIMTPGDEFISGPTEVTVIPAQPGGQLCSNITFASAFNWIGSDVCCLLNDPLAKGAAGQVGESISILFKGQLEPSDGSADANQLNTITVSGASRKSDGTCPATVEEASFDCSDEDHVAIDVKECVGTLDKDVTCDDPIVTATGRINNAANWAETNVEALPGSEVAFRIELTNTGDTTWTNINITDALSGICDPSWYIASSVVCEITTPPSTITNVTSCICLNPVGNCDNFADLSGLKPLNSAGCTNGLDPGEKLTCTLKLLVPAGFMQLNTPEDCRNTVTVQPDVGICRGTTNPCGQLTSFATVNVKVPKIECDKLSCPDVGANNAVNTCDAGTELGSSYEICVEDQSAPLRVIYRYTAVNTGEVPFASSKACDPDLRADVLANAAGGVTTMCAFDANGCIPTVAGTVTCSVTFPNFAAWQAFAAKDGNAAGREKYCYDNSATMMANVNTTGLCSRGAVTTVTSSDLCAAESCFRPPCSVYVEKQVKCLDTCSDSELNATTGWHCDKSCSGNADKCCDVDADCGAGQTCVQQPALEVAPGACLGYRIRITNTSTTGVSLPGPLTLNDTMSNAGVFATGPTSVMLPTGWVCPNFNWTGTDVTCTLPGADPLDPGEVAIIKFRGELKNPAAMDAMFPGAIPDPVNTVTVNGASEECGGIGGCEDSSRVPVDIKRCAFTVTKDVTCDDPRLPNPSFDPGVQDVLPGSEVAFRIQVCNTGEIDIPKITITDDFVRHPSAPVGVSCNWPLVAGSVQADIAGVNVLSCMCPGGVCGSLGTINGMKVFDKEDDAAVGAMECRLGGIRATPAGPDECLTITFKLEVPSTFSNKNTTRDCQNQVTVSVTPAGDVCKDSNDNICGNPKRDDVDVNVLVPEIECDKRVCLDRQADGSCDSGYENALVITGGEAFPLALIYQVIVHNNGETDLKDVKVTDAELISDAGVHLGVCDLAPAGAMIALIPAMSDAAPLSCRLVFNTPEELDAFFALDGGRPDAYVNTVQVEGVPSVPTSGPTRVCESDILYESLCSATVSRETERCHCPCVPVTKARFDIFNENESKFSGMERCIESWDERLLSEYTLDEDGHETGVPNYFWHTVLGTDKGMARIDGIASPNVCGGDSVNAPLIGVASKLVYFDNGKLDRTGMSLVGVGAEAGQLFYEVRDGEAPPEPLGELIGGRGGTSNPDSNMWDRYRDNDGEDGSGGRYGTIERAVLDNNSPVGGIAQKGSLLAFAKVQARWNAQGQLIEDTFIDIANDGANDVHIQAYLVNGDLCATVDRGFTLTKNQPAFWSAGTIDPVYGPSLPELFDQCPDMDDDDHDGRPDNPGGRIARGYLVLWAVDPATLHEIRWNHLKGDALIVNYRDGAAWEYEAWSFRAVAGTRSGDQLLAPYGQLDLDAMEYDAVPDTLLLDFYASGATLGRAPGPMATVDTDLTLWAVLKNLRHDAPVPDCTEGVRR